jgi:branched-chain amino acid transport system permease protein
MTEKGNAASRSETALAVCDATVIERIRLGAILRAAIENRALVQAFGIRCGAPRRGARRADLPMSPLMGSIITLVFAIVVIGGIGSILGAVVSGLPPPSSKKAGRATGS